MYQDLKKVQEGRTLALIKQRILQLLASAAVFKGVLDTYGATHRTLNSCWYQQSVCARLLLCI